MREPQAAGWTLVFPVFLLILFTLIWGKTPGYVNYIVPGLVGVSTASTSFYGLGAVIVAYRQFGYLKKVRTTPLPPSVFLAGIVCSRILVIMLSALLLTGIAVAFFSLRIVNIFAFFAAIIFGGITFSFLGLLIASFCSTVNSAGAMAHMAFFPMIFLSHAFIPSSMFPSFLRKVSLCLPLTHFVRLLRGALDGRLQEPTVVSAALIVLGFLVVGLLVDIYRMRTMEIL